MTRREYTTEIIRQWANELNSVLEQVSKFSMDRVAKHGYFDVSGAAIAAEQVDQNHWGPRLKALAASEVARDLASTASAHDGGPDPKLVAEIFSDGQPRKTDFLVKLLQGAREIHVKTGKGVGYPFFPFFSGADRKNGEALAKALTVEERKLLGVGEFEVARPPVAPASGSLDVLLKHIEERSAYTGRSPAQAFFNYFSPDEDEKDEKKEKKAADHSKSVAAKSLDIAADLGDLGKKEVKETKVSKISLEEIAAPPAPTVSTAPVVADLGAPAPKVETTSVSPAASSVEGNGKAPNGGAEAVELADLLTATEKPVAMALANQLRQGKIGMDAAKARARKYGLI